MPSCSRQPTRWRQTPTAPALVAHILVGAVPNYGPDDTERFVREIIMPFDTLQIGLAHLAGAGGFGIQQQACFEELLPRWGLHRVLWGSDNSDHALALTRTQWPLDATAWQAIADQRGTALVAA